MTMDITPRFANIFEKRQYYGSGSTSCNCYGCYYSYGDCYYSGWNAYGRWILLAAIVIGAFLIFLVFSCITARRRRKVGQHPYPLTGWASRPPPGHGPAQYNGGPGPYGQSQPPAPYGGQPNYGGPGNAGYQNHAGAPPPSYGANASYYGQESGIAQPGQSYQPTREEGPVYNAPSGPPPGKS